MFYFPVTKKSYIKVLFCLVSSNRITSLRFTTGQFERTFKLCLLFTLQMTTEFREVRGDLQRSFLSASPSDLSHSCSSIL